MLLKLSPMRRLAFDAGKLFWQLWKRPKAEKTFDPQPPRPPPTETQPGHLKRIQRRQRARILREREVALADRIISPGRLKRLNELGMKRTMGTHSVRRDRRQLIDPVARPPAGV